MRGRLVVVYMLGNGEKAIGRVVAGTRSANPSNMLMSQRGSASQHHCPVMPFLFGRRGSQGRKSCSQMNQQPMSECCSTYREECSLSRGREMGTCPSNHAPVQAVPPAIRRRNAVRIMEADRGRKEQGPWFQEQVCGTCWEPSKKCPMGVPKNACKCPRSCKVQNKENAMLHDRG